MKIDLITALYQALADPLINTLSERLLNSPSHAFILAWTAKGPHDALGIARGYLLHDASCTRAGNCNSCKGRI